MTGAHPIDELLGLTLPAVAVKFCDVPPSGLARVSEAAPSGCTYWKLAAEGQSFYTEASDHYNCPVGAYTHGAELPPAQGKELEGLIGTMISLEYLRQDEIAGIPRREEPFRYVVYAPLGEASVEPDVVLVAGNARQVMLLAEAAGAAGLRGGAVMGRPTCAAIPEVMKSHSGVTNLGCIGNRVYTARGDDELYFAFPGDTLPQVVERLRAIVNANRELEQFHAARIA